MNRVGSKFILDLGIVNWLENFVPNLPCSIEAGDERIKY